MYARMLREDDTEMVLDLDKFYAAVQSPTPGVLKIQFDGGGFVYAKVTAQELFKVLCGEED